MTLVQFRASKFELYELVTLHWNSQEHQTKVVQRWFNPDDGLNGYWFDRVADDDRFYPESKLRKTHNPGLGIP